MQSRPDSIVVLYTRFAQCKTVTTKVLAALVERGVLPRGVPAFRAKVPGVIGRTASGYPLEVENGPGVLLVVLPKAIAETSASLAHRETEGMIGHSMIISGDGDIEDGDEGPFTAACFGGVAEGRTEQVEPSTGQASDTDGIMISWRRLAAAKTGAPGFSGLNIQVTIAITIASSSTITSSITITITIIISSSSSSISISTNTNCYY